MISYATIESKLISALDAEGSQRYNFADDYRPAVNYAIDFAVSVFNSVFSQNKKSEEILAELSRVRIWRASQYSRFAFDSTIVGDQLWSILAVIPNPTTTGASTGAVTDEGQYEPLMSFLSGGYPCKRLTPEQWIEKDRNPFMPGNPYNTCDETIQYGYVAFADYVGGYQLVNNAFEIEVSPNVANQFVAVRYLRKPVSVSIITDNIDFPEVMTNFITEQALKFISFKQNDNTNLYSVTSKDIMTLSNLFA